MADITGKDRRLIQIQIIDIPRPPTGSPRSGHCDGMVHDRFKLMSSKLSC